MKSQEKKSAGFVQLINENIFTFFICGIIIVLISWPFLSSFLLAPLHLIFGFFFSILFLLFVLLVASVIVDKKQ